MADEIGLNVTLTVANSTTYKRIINTTLTQTTPGFVSRRQTIPTSDTVITLTGVTAPVLVMIENKDATNYVDIGNTTGGAILEFARLQPGKQQPIWLFPSTVLRAKAHTGSVVIETSLVET